MGASQLSRAAQRFYEEIGVALAPISGRFVYLDTVQALLPRWLPTTDLSELARLNPGASIFERRRFGDLPVGDLATCKHPGLGSQTSADRAHADCNWRIRTGARSLQLNPD
jgi:hypothetical protein